MSSNEGVHETGAVQLQRLSFSGVIYTGYMPVGAIPTTNELQSTTKMCPKNVDYEDVTNSIKKIPSN